VGGLAAAWLMKENQWDVTKALHKLKKKRPIVCPNEVSAHQLATAPLALHF
jgi:protein-tyrosine phosphatase